VRLWMTRERVLLLGPPKPIVVNGLVKSFELHELTKAEDAEKLLSEIGESIRAIAVTSTVEKIDSRLMSRFPKLEIVSSFGVGYDHIDTKWARDHNVVVTNTPDVLTEEVADTALGLLLYTLQRCAQHSLLSTASLRGRTVGILGLGRIGKAIARRLDAFGVRIVYFGRRPQPDVPYTYYSDLVRMAGDVDTLIAVVPGGAGTMNMINAEVLEALGPDGILINMARGSVVDENALIQALRNRTILSAGLDVFFNEPDVPQELIEMEHIVLLPHVGSASEYTRGKMDQLIVDNLVAWAAGKPPISPVPETPARLRASPELPS
jgi:lactate dehydrogenase-like 2-hydroxyacid dehydrogenase